MELTKRLVCTMSWDDDSYIKLTNRVTNKKIGMPIVCLVMIIPT